MEQIDITWHKILKEDFWKLQTGEAFLAYGVHDSNNITDAGTHWLKGDHWWGIICWDVWRKDEGFVFAKDGKPVWTEPTHFAKLNAPL